MLNPFVMKKWVLLLLLPLFCATSLYVGVFFLGFWKGLGCLAGMLIVSMLIGNYFLWRNPFTQMLEGEGLLFIDMSSTGFIQPFLCKLQMPFMKANINGKEIKDVFDREHGVYNLGGPIQTGIAQMREFEEGEKGLSEVTRTEEDGELVIRIPLKQLSKSRFQWLQWPVILFNQSTGSTITKDWFSEKEKGAMAEHAFLYQNKMLEELSSNVLHFARSVIELIKPKGEGWFSGKTGWIIIIAIIVILLLLFGKPLMNTFMNFMGTAKTSLGSSLPSGTITPR